MSPAASSRWCPTPEQLMILEELYRSGTTTPNAPQIQRITAQLSLYGKIEGKNVFYWFQNHKARDRQKLRRKLIKQLQHQQLYHHHSNFLNYFESPLPTSSSSSAFLPFPYQHNYSAPFFPHQGGIGGAPTETTSQQWKVEIPQNVQIGNSMMRMYGYDWMTMTMEVGPTNPPRRTKPLETLELFPIRSTNLKEGRNIASSSSSSSSSN